MTKESLPANLLTVQEKCKNFSYEELLEELCNSKIRFKHMQADIAWLRAQIASNEFDGEC